jgi:hypothetical protein
MRGRKDFFPNPTPAHDKFYIISDKATRDNYYAWEWGDALFVILDPFMESSGKGRDWSNWDITLGEVSS